MPNVPTGEVFQSVHFGNYILVSQLGKGGMAEVFKARMAGIQGFEKVVCIKRILRQHNDDKHFVDMFVNEAKISAKLSHPNVVAVYELGEVDGEFFMAMEFVHGRDLLRVMRAHGTDGPPPPAVGAYIAREMCRALSHAHDHIGEDRRPQPIVHRDVSPQNVMISYDGIVKLVDFGIAKALEAATIEETRTGALKGKFAYMAPEQLDGQKASPLTDIFSVGVVLFEMLTGRRLFKGNTDYDTLVRVKTQPVPPPSELAPEVSPELDRIVLTALERDASRRYQRASLMARDLEQLCGKMGFTSEDMKEFMTQLFPNREEVPDGVVALATPHSASGVYGSTPAGPSTSVGTAAGKFRPSSRRPLTMGTGSNSTTPLLPAATARKEDSASNSMAGAPKRSRAGMLVAIGLLVAAGGGAAFAVVHWNDGGHPGKARPSAEGGESGETETDEAPIKPKPAAKKVVEEPREEPTVGGKVQLASAPSGAQVLDGPRVLGTTPMTIKLTDDRPSLTVHLAKSGYDELAYTVSMADAPGVTLKLNAAKRHVESGPSRPKKSNEKASSPSETPLKVKSFDDVDPSGPKVKAIDE